MELSLDKDTAVGAGSKKISDKPRVRVGDTKENVIKDLGKPVKTEFMNGGEELLHWSYFSLNSSFISFVPVTGSFSSLYGFNGVKCAFSVLFSERGRVLEYKIRA